MLAADLIGNLLFSGIGFVALAFAKKQGRLKTALIGVLLMFYPYFVSGTLILYGVGIVLTICLFMFTD